jgi:hypothetical protein
MRKVIEFEEEMLEALKQFAAERNQTLSEIAHDACALLLNKHGRPTNLKEALEMSLRRLPQNDNRRAKSQQVR